MKKNLLGLTLEQLKSEFSLVGLTNLDAKRIFPWIHTKFPVSFDEMSDLPKHVRTLLSEHFSIDLPKCSTMQKSSDGTQKVLLELDDGNSVESVFIPDDKRNTACISTQIGCAMACKFCHTGTQPFLRNLTSSEIMAQVFFWKNMLRSSPVEKRLTNLVFMGMGEPLLNYEHLASSLELLLGEKSHNFSRTKITVSTSGIVGNQLKDMSRFGVKLAISLHAPNDEKRSSLMPINKKFSLRDVLDASNEYLKMSNTEHITFEYLLLKGENDSDGDAYQLATLLQKIPCKINLILFNRWSGCNFVGSKRERADEFLRILLSRGIRTVIRKSRGNDILAACGQLKSL